MSQDPRALVQKAEKMLASAGTGFSFFGGREEKYRDAAELYNLAANALRMQDKNLEAGKTLEAMASIYKQKLNEPDIAASTLLSAFTVYRKESPEDAARCLEDAIQYYSSHGEFRRAAKYKANLGVLFEVELRDPERAIPSYEKAAAWYEGDNAPSTATGNWIKAAELSAVTAKRDYYRSIENFEKAVQTGISGNLPYSAKECLLKVAMCHMAAGDLISAQRALARFEDMEERPASNPDYMLLVSLMEIIEARDTARFSAARSKYETTKKLDNWKKVILEQAKEKMEQAGGGANDFS